MNRRSFLLSTAALALPLPLRAAEPFDPAMIETHARELASRPYAPRPTIPQPWLDLTYDQHRLYWFNEKKAVWNDTPSPFKIDLFHPGLYYPRGVTLNLVEDGVAEKLPFDFSLFDHTDKAPDLPVDDTLGYAGIRLRAELEKPGIFQEFFVMQGASYFRAIGLGETYGLSARGLAIDTAEPDGEEFPEFIELWVERPAPGSQTIRLHALMDSPSASGAYTFDITHGAQALVTVNAVIFAREELRNFGLAPLTSMFLFDETNRNRFADFRDAVHDNDGLLIRNGAGETIWRPLANPATLQVSAFVDDNPKGFGLMQRARDLADFGDLHAHYQDRPGLWIEPSADWGKGSVILVEIPSDKEIYDNIVAYWRPETPLPAGAEHRFSYRMTWGQEPVPPTDLARVHNTRIGKAFGEGIVVAIDFEQSALTAEAPDAYTWVARTSAGDTTPGTLERNPETGGFRLAFTFHPGEATLAEFRAVILKDEHAVSETWLYRWTA